MVGPPGQSPQGRAPWWSPNGTLIAFETNRFTGTSYQICIQCPLLPWSITPVTPPGLGVQHAKWSPDSRRLVFAYAEPGGGGQGIAYIELGDLFGLRF
jgi:Tol biopolymer transport system component